MRSRIKNIESEARELAGAATLIADMAAQALDKGGTVNAAKQTAFITGAYARLLKDLGVIEQLQGEGHFIKKKPIVNGRASLGRHMV